MPSVYANVTNYFDWIEDTVFNNGLTIKPLTNSYGKYYTEYTMNKNVTCPASKTVHFRFKHLDVESVDKFNTGDYIVIEFGSHVKSE